MLIKNDITLRSQDEIISSWTNEKTIMVSIVCTTYNHEPFIKDAIESFLLQETNFAIEIIIHDDASTDKTACIINKYHEQYPLLINSIIQKENQYSKGGFKPILYASARAKGKFIALCEADDHWVDNNKLQEQYNAMMGSLKPSLCFHSATELDMHSFHKKKISNHYSNDQISPIKDVITGGGNFMPTASIMFRNEHLSKLEKMILNAPVGDYFIQVYMSTFAGAYYINKNMSVYRINTSGSWSSQHSIGSEALIKAKMKMVLSIEDFAEKLNIENYTKHFMTMMSIFLLQSIRDSSGLTKKATSIKLIFKTISELKWMNKIHFFGVLLITSISFPLKSIAKMVIKKFRILNRNQR